MPTTGSAWRQRPRSSRASGLARRPSPEAKLSPISHAITSITPWMPNVMRNESTGSPVKLRMPSQVVHSEASERTNAVVARIESCQFLESAVTSRGPRPPPPRAACLCASTARTRAATPMPTTPAWSASARTTPLPLSLPSCSIISATPAASPQ
jgi:hypothetical protein